MDCNTHTTYTHNAKLALAACLVGEDKNNLLGAKVAELRSGCRALGGRSGGHGVLHGVKVLRFKKSILAYSLSPLSPLHQLQIHTWENEEKELNFN